MIIRAEGAQQNGFENIGLFAAAVVIGNVAKLDNSTLNTLSGAYLASRVVYNLLYIYGTTDFLGKLNEFEYCIGIGLNRSSKYENWNVPLGNWHYLDILYQKWQPSQESIVG